MQFSKFDTILWKINGVLFLATFSVGLFSIIFFIYSSNVNRRVENVVTVLDSKKEDFIKFEEFKFLRNTDYLISNLISVKSKGSSFKSYGPFEIKNVLFFNKTKKNSEWLFPTNQNYILNDYSYVHDNINEDCNSECSDIKSKVLGLVFSFADQDTNKDGLIDEKDKLTVIYKDISLGKIQKIITNIDSLISVKRISKSEIGVFYIKNNKSLFVYYDFVKNITTAEEKF